MPRYGPIARLLGLAAVLCMHPSFAPVRSGSAGAIEDQLVQRGLTSAARPAVTPLLFETISREDARLINAATPFAASVGAAASPFRLGGSEDSRERAVDCLASAMWYEAGSDTADQRAVAQVVLNRARHPAFPATICGVVFQGAERATGCQFTFTCDGSFRRRPSEVALRSARATAAAMLSGAVDRRVGLATHYHTDWVHPIWSGSMVKLAQVDSHLFFRWAGSWGEAAAFRGSSSLEEPFVAKLGFLSLAHRAASTSPQTELASFGVDPGSAASPTRGSPATSAGSSAHNAFRVEVSETGTAAVPAMAALDLCAGRAFCKVLGYDQVNEVVFVYVRDRWTGVERSLWKCDLFPRRNLEQCLDASNRKWIDFDGNLNRRPSPGPAVAAEPHPALART